MKSDCTDVTRHLCKRQGFPPMATSAVICSRKLPGYSHKRLGYASFSSPLSTLCHHLIWCSIPHRLLSVDHSLVRLCHLATAAVLRAIVRVEDWAAPQLLSSVATIKLHLRSELLTAAKTSVVVFWVVTSCGPVGDNNFQGHPVSQPTRPQSYI
jgi:hypothetical protein